MEPHISKYDGWTRLGPQKSGGSAQQGSGNSAQHGSGGFAGQSGGNSGSSQPGGRMPQRSPVASQPGGRMPQRNPASSQLGGRMPQRNPAASQAGSSANSLPDALADSLAKMAAASGASAGAGGINQEINMTQTGFLTSKNGKRFIRVEFSRRGTKGFDTAEGIIPGGKILKQNGFSDQEIASLEFYLKHNKEEIVSRAKELSNPLHWFG